MEEPRIRFHWSFFLYIIEIHFLNIIRTQPQHSIIQFLFRDFSRGEGGEKLGRNLFVHCRIFFPCILRNEIIGAMIYIIIWYYYDIYDYRSYKLSHLPRWFNKYHGYFQFSWVRYVPFSLPPYVPYKKRHMVSRIIGFLICDF